MLIDFISIGLKKKRKTVKVCAQKWQCKKWFNVFLNFRQISDEENWIDLPPLPGHKTEEDLLPKYSGGNALNEYGKCLIWKTLGNKYLNFVFLIILDIKVVPMEFNVTKRCKNMSKFLYLITITVIIFFYSGYIFCKKRPTTTPPLLFPEGDTGKQISDLQFNLNFIY